MKKIILVLYILISGILYSQDKYKESWVTLGFQSSFSFEDISVENIDATREIDYQGVNFSGYTFWNGKNLGIFASDTFVVPNELKIKMNGSTGTVNFSDFDFKFLVGITIGPVYRIKINDRSYFRVGIGPSLHQFSTRIDETETSTLTYYWGIGSDIGYKYDITESIFFDIGAKLGKDFFSTTTIRNEYGSGTIDSNDYDSFSMNRVAIYIGFGLNMYNTWNIGKPKK